MIYTIKTDGVMQDVAAESMDKAAVEFAASEGICGVTSAADLLAEVENMGGWCWIEPTGDPAGRINLRTLAQAGGEA